MTSILKKTLNLVVLLFLALPLGAQDIMDRLSAVPQVSDVKILKSNRFEDKYLISFTQPIDHKNPSKGTFQQRVIACIVHPDSATVLVCEGYGANYALNENYRNEISELFNTNDIVVEHRFFPGSTPYPGISDAETDWSSLTAENAACDLHEIVVALKNVFNGKWISTGISKGGQNTLIYRAFFPKDVDLSVPYVAPLCRGVEDGRHESFIAAHCGNASERKAVEAFQIEFLKRRERIQPLFDQYCRKHDLDFPIPSDEVYDFCALEFSFSFWQWGTPVSDIPPATASDTEILDFMLKITSPDYFTHNANFTPFFIQAARELGYYGYDTAPFKEYLHISDADGYLERIFLPEGTKFHFNRNLYLKLSAFLKETDARMLFVYGDYDPWSAACIDNPGHKNIKVYFAPGGSHRARISSFPRKTQSEIVSVLENWLHN